MLESNKRYTDSSMNGVHSEFEYRVSNLLRVVDGNREHRLNAFIITQRVYLNRRWALTGII